MQPSFTYSDLQKRFCEGFTFFPFSGLEQAGRYIYKCYTQEANTPGLLDQHESHCGFGSLHARVLLLKLLQKDIPFGKMLLSKLGSESAGLAAYFHRVGSASAMSRQLLETMANYHRLLSVYQHQVQEHMATQLAALCNRHADTFCKMDISKGIDLARAMVEEFLGSTDIMYDCLLACSLRASGFHELSLAESDLDALRDLMGMIDEFRCQQEKTIYVLEQWRQEHMKFNQKNIMN